MLPVEGVWYTFRVPEIVKIINERRSIIDSQWVNIGRVVYQNGIDGRMGLRVEQVMTSSHFRNAVAKGLRRGPVRGHQYM